MGKLIKKILKYKIGARHEFLKFLEEVLKRLRAANLTINEEKSHFCKNSLIYLGYVVDSHGLHVDSEKVESICQYLSPKTVHG